MHRGSYVCEIKNRKDSMALPALKDSSEGSEIFSGAVDRSDLGGPNSLRYAILTRVLGEDYDKAIGDLREFLDRPSPYPNFKEKANRYINHSIDLIYAIKAKRSFPGINSLTRAKQQELREKFKEHFRELQYILKVIEQIQTDLRIQDVRSTVYVVRALWVALLAVMVMAFWLEIVNGLAHTSLIVFDDLFGKLANFLADKLGL